MRVSEYIICRTVFAAGPRQEICARRVHCFGDICDPVQARLTNASFINIPQHRHHRWSPSGGRGPVGSSGHDMYRGHTRPLRCKTASRSPAPDWVFGMLFSQTRWRFFPSFC